MAIGLSKEFREILRGDLVVAHLMSANGDHCTRCGQTAEHIHDYRIPCGLTAFEKSRARDAMRQGQGVVGDTPFVIERESPSVIEDLRRKVASLIEQLRGADAMLLRERTNYELSCVARDQLRSENRLLKEENARLKTELDRHPWARRIK